jgi:hypothetical protein
MMNSHSCRRALLWTSVCVAAALATPVSFGADKDRQQAQAQLLDHAEFLCDNCFFAPSQYYYCFAAGNQILVGYQSTPVLNWGDKSKNYLSIAHPEWAAWIPPGPAVPISYDAKHIWVSRADSKQVKLKRSSKRDIFANNDQCRAADSAKAH